MKNPLPTLVNRRTALRGALTLLAGGHGAALRAQAAESKVLRLLLPYPAGSGPDAFVRQLGERLSVGGGQTPLVDNRPGANGFVAIGEARRAAADGSTLLALDSTHTALYPLLFKQLPFDLARDFEPVVPLYQTWFYVVVAADAPYRSLADLLAAARRSAGALSYGSSGMGSVPHVGAAMLEAATGTRMTHVPYKDLQQLLGDVASARVDWIFGTAATISSLLKANKLRYLALAAPVRAAASADVPTVAESPGLAGFELKTWVALFAPRGAPRPVLERRASAIRQVMSESDFRARWSALGLQTWLGSDADVSNAVAAETARFAEIIKHARITLD